MVVLRGIDQAEEDSILALLPDQPPGNEDCKYFNDCDNGSPEGTGPDGGPNGGLGEGGSPALVYGHPVHFRPSLAMFRR